MKNWKKIVRDELELPNEIAGHFEIECIYNDNHEQMPSADDNDTVSYEHEAEQDDATVTSTSSGRFKPKCSRSHNYHLDKTPFDDTANSYKALYE